MRGRLGQENAQVFECTHDGCTAPLRDLMAIHQHCFTCVPPPPFPLSLPAQNLAIPESSSGLANVFLTTHRDVAGARLALTLALLSLSTGPPAATPARTRRCPTPS